MLNQDNIVPLYEQLMNILEHDIRTGKYSPGDRIMTESELSQEIRHQSDHGPKGDQSADRKGLTDQKAGQGNLCRKPKYSRNIRRLSGFTQMCEQMGVVPGGRMLDNRLIAADEKTAKKLGVAPGSDIIYIHRLRYANNEPVIIERNYFPPKYAELLQRRFDNESLFAYLKEHMGVICKESEKLIELCHVTGEGGQHARCEARRLHDVRQKYRL